MSRCLVDSLTYCIVGKQLVMTVIASLASIARSAAIVVVDSSQTTAWPPSTNLAAARPIASFAATDAVRRYGKSLSNKLERKAVAPPRTLRSTPSASSMSRSRCTVIRHLPSSTDPPRRCSPVPCAHWSTGTVQKAAQTRQKHGLRRSVAGSAYGDRSEAAGRRGAVPLALGLGAARSGRALHTPWLR